MWVAAFALSLAGTTLCGASRPNLLRPTGPVVSSSQAIAIALHAAAKIYHTQIIDEENSLQVRRVGAIWQVHGSLPQRDDGGVLEVTIDAVDGTVRAICHGK